MQNTTLPASSNFWNKYYPPNGWRCRCVAVEVNADKHQLTDEQTAIKHGETATTQLDKNGKNALEIFRFNPGKQQVIFPPNHPYTYSKSKDTDKNKALEIAKELAGENNTLKQQRHEIKQWAKQNLVGKPLELDGKKITLSTKDVKDILNQPHDYIKEKNELLKNLPDILSKSTFVKTALEIKGREQYKGWHYYKYKENFYLNIVQMDTGDFKLHSIGDHLK